MSIHGHIGTLMCVTTVAGLLLALFLRGEYRELDAVSMELRANARAESDLHRLEGSADHFLLLADLVLSGESTFLVDTVSDQAEVNAEMIESLRRTPLSIGKHAELDQLEAGIALMTHLAETAAFASGPDREEVIAESVQVFEATSLALIAGLEDVRAGFTERAEARRGLEVEQRSLVEAQTWRMGGIYLIAVLMTFAWTTRRLVKPLQVLSRSARMASLAVDEFRLEASGPTEVREVTHSFTELIQHLEEARSSLEERVLERTRELEEALEVKTQFLASMSHEIRTPMNGVIGMTDVLGGTDLDEEQELCVETIRSSGSSLVKVIDDILDFSKLETRKVVLERLEFDLKAIVVEVVQLLSSQTKVGVELAWRIPSDFPPRLIGDPHRIRQVITNLVGNAAKFTAEGSITVVVESVAVTGRDDWTRVSIRDTGIGIPEEAIDSLFAPFSQADNSTTRRFGGTGLGLSISSSLVELMGGRIRVESEVGVGSTFSFELPLEHVAPPENSAVEGGDQNPLSLVGAARDEAVKPRILVAEDNSVNRLVAGKMLAKLGYEVDFALDGVEALEFASRDRHALILMDCHMPEMDGLEATRRLRALPEYGEEVVIIALTANVVEGVRKEIREAGMDDYLSKPVKLGVLGETLERWCREGRATDRPWPRSAS